MKKTCCRLLLAALLAVLTLAPMAVETAHAQDYDRILNYQVDVTPDVSDGSLLIRVDLDWMALEDLPARNAEEGGAKIGIPNGSIHALTGLTDNIASISNDNSYVYIDFTQSYDAGESFHFAYSWVQEYMYILGDNGEVTYDYTPGWFTSARVDSMTLTWHDPGNIYGAGTDGQYGGDHVLTASDMGHGEQLPISVTYGDWPTQLDEQMSRYNLPDDYYGQDYGDGYDDDYGSDPEAVFISLVVFFVVCCIIVSAITATSYRAGFGTRYVYVGGLWYPRGPDGRPRPGSVGTKHRPAPPRSSGFGGGSRGGGFGGGGFGGGGHCACASSCACACACACAGGGRAGCSAKNLYGAIHADASVEQQLRRKS